MGQWAWLFKRIEWASNLDNILALDCLQKHAGAGQCERVERAARRGTRAGAGTVLTMPIPRRTTRSLW